MVEEIDVIKKVPGIEDIMEKLGKTISDSDEISIPQLTSQFMIWLQANKSKPNFFENEFKMTFTDLIRSIHLAQEGGPHLVCHVSEFQESEADAHVCEPSVEEKQKNT